MLIDNEQKLIDLFIDNIIWGNVTIHLENWTAKDPTAKDVAISLGNWINTRRHNEKIPSKLLDEVYGFIVTGRFTDVIRGELRDRDHEITLTKLQSDNEKLVNVVAEQKEKIDEYICNAVDPKNIRGIG